MVNPNVANSLPLSLTPESNIHETDKRTNRKMEKKSLLDGSKGDAVINM
jgi:hypothetical protein